MFIADILSLVKGIDAVEQACGDRVSWRFSLETKPTQPYVTLWQVSGVADLTHSGESGLQDARVQIDCIAASAVQAANLRRAIRRALNGYKGTVGDTTINACIHGNSIDFNDPATYTFTASADFLFQYTEQET